MVFVGQALSYAKCHVTSGLLFYVVFLSTVLVLSTCRRTHVCYPSFCDEAWCVLFQTLVLYWMYPYVWENLDVLLAMRAHSGLHVRTDKFLRRLDCHILDGVSVKTLVLAVDPGGLDFDLSQFCSWLSFVSMCDNVRLGRALAAVSHPVMPIVSRRFDKGSV